MLCCRRSTARLTIMQTQFLTFFVSTLSLASVVSSACVNPWVQKGSQCFLAQASSSSGRGHQWHNARRACQTYGADLIKVESADAFGFVNDLFKDSRNKQNHYWIGLNDNETEGTWKWADNTLLDSKKTNWRSGEPSDWKNNEDCVEVTYDGKWNDNGCIRELGYICERLASSTLPTTPPPPIFPNSTDKPSTCEAGWIPWGTSCYGIIRGISKSWDDALADCHRRFGDLLVINSKEEEAFIANEIGNTDNEYWIGLSDKHREGDFIWVDGTELNKTTTFWRDKEPSNDYGNEDCVEIYGKYDKGKWNDNLCSSKRSYICEKRGGLHNCPKDWVSYNNYCYQINAHPNQAVTWDEARQQCLDFNKRWRNSIDVAEAELVSILSQGEQEFIVKEFAKFGVTQPKFWIGLTDKNASNLKDFYWTDGSYLEFNLWSGASADKSKQCVASLFDYQKNAWSQEDCSKKLRFVCKISKGQDRCYDPLGIQSFLIPNSAMTASSSLSPETSAPSGRLFLKANKQFNIGGAWCAGNGTRQWLQIDFAETKKLTYMSMQGKSDSDDFVTSYYLRSSIDGISWDTYGNVPPAGYFKFRTYLSWRTTREKVMNLPLPLPLVARYIRVYPLDSNLEKCMRVEFYGCEDEIENQRCGLYWEQDKKTKNCYKFSRRKTTWDAAQQLCSAEGANLVSIGSLDELNFLKEKLIEHKENLDMFWVGLNDLDTEGIRRWVDNTPLVIRNWYRGNPKIDNDKSNCVAMRTDDGFWSDEDCTTLNAFICERTYKSPYTPKDPFNNNWKSKTDYYWPLDAVPINNMIEGTIPGNAYGGKFSQALFPVSYSKMKSRYTLQFPGKSSYIRIDNIDDCVSHPDSSSCPHGFSVSFLFKYKQPSSNRIEVILSTLQKSDSVGFEVYLNYNKIVVVVQRKETHFTTNTYFNKNVYNHITFTWSPIDGLDLYLNSIRSSSLLYGSKNTKVLTKLSSNKLYIGKSSDTKAIATEFYMSSLAIFERVITSEEVQQIYLSELGECKSHQIAHGSYCYEFNTTIVNWNAALATCRKNNGDLMSVHSPVEQALLTINAGNLGYGAKTWIGLNSKAKVTSFNWTDGSKVVFSHWMANEPNNWNRRIENCVLTWPTNAMWNDGVCYIRHATACKYQRQILPMGAADTSATTYTYTIPYFVTRTFGCPYPLAISIVKADYGSSTKNCFLDADVVKNYVTKTCKGSSCNSIRATDSFFGSKNPCAGKGYARKTLTVTYKCGEKIKDYPDSTTCNDQTVTGYTVFDKSGVCYKLYRQPKSFDDALKSCQKDKGTLVVINSRNVQMFLTSLMDELYTKQDVWIGMRYNTNTSTYYWINNAKVNYTHWYNKQPDPRDGEYIKVGVEEGARDFLYWKPGNRNDTLPYFCQRYQPSIKTPIPPTTKAPNGTCPPGWFKHTKHCYYVNNVTLSYVDAKLECRKFGKNSHLASVLSATENDKIFYDFINRTVLFSWIGLSNEDLLSGFHWEDSSPVVYVNWFYNRPYTGNKHFCTGIGSGGKWWDIPCNSKLASLCKLPLGEDLPSTTRLPLTDPIPTKDSYLCKNGWRYFNGSCYYISSSLIRVDYYAARNNCIQLGGNLASILNQQENDFIKRHLWGRTYYGSFIGLTDRGSESEWKWADYSPVNYLNFEKGEPNNFNGMEDCVTMKGSGYWKDEACNMKRSFVCKQTNGTKVIPPTKIVPPNTGYCDSGWVLYGSKCYLFVYGKGNRRKFDDARDYCKTVQKAQLVSIHHNYEDAFLLSQLHDANEPIFIGLTDKIIERSFIWTDQTSVDYTNWAPLQPSRYGDEDCVEIMPYFRTRGKWNDINCNFPHGFICQRTHSETPPATAIPTATPEDPCPSGWVKFRKSCYSMNKSPLSFEDALKECRKYDDSDILSIHDPFEQAFAFSYFAQAATHSWIGLRQMDRAAPTWSDNSPYDYKYWSTIKYTSQFLSKDKCVTQEFSTSVDGKWRYRNCTEKFPYMCKLTRDFDKTKQSGFIGNCSTGWTKVNDKCYRVFSKYSEKATWASARANCRSNGGDLVSVTSKELQTSLQYMIRNMYTPVWIGLNDRDKEFQFRWSDGTPLLPDSFSNWKYGEPSDTKAKENCVEMSPNDGKWNDLGCFGSLSYICEHKLECRSALGMEDGSIPDANIMATSYVGEYFPKHARLMQQRIGKDKAWCTSVTSGTESLTINLGEQMSITRINTQGLYDINQQKRCFVTGYMIDYSTDGKHWMSYVDKPSDPDNVVPKTMPGNSDSKSIGGELVDIKATYIRITPKYFKGDKICMKIELFGCKSKCKRALGMENEIITNDQIQVSSIKQGSKKEYLRPNNKDKYWCAKEARSTEYIQIDLKRNEYQITRIMVATPPSEKQPLKYLLKFSEDGVNFRMYNTLENRRRLFSSAQSVYDLDLVQTTRYVRIVPAIFDKSFCLQVELYGCIYVCDKPMGMQSKFIPDKVISASTEMSDHMAKMARISTGEYNKNAWCAKENNKMQYLQVDFTQQAHINQIAVQGYDGDNAKYVTQYEVQWSNDKNFWQHTVGKMVGNKNGYSIETRKLSNPIIARYIRLNPVEWVNGICMRVEFYGCALNAISEPVKPHKKHLSGAIRFTSIEYTPKLASQNSIEFGTLAAQIEEEITRIYAGSATLKYGFESVTVNSFKPGSVVAEFTIYSTETEDATDVTEPLSNAVKSGKLGNLVVDKEYNLFKEVKSGAQKSDDIGGLSNGGKIALVVFFVVIIAIIIIIGLVYYKRSKKNGFRLQFAHKSFENPVHTDDQDEVGFIGSQD